MEEILKRPVSKFDPSKGLLHNDYFQLGYVTNDMDKALRIFRERFGVTEFRESDTDLPSGSRMRLRTAWIGSMMYEILCASGPGMEIYTDAAPGPDFVLKHHHFGCLVEDDEAWEALEREIVRGHWAVRLRHDSPDFARVCYLDAPELGHYLEFIQPRDEFIRRWNATPIA